MIGVNMARDPFIHFNNPLSAGQPAFRRNKFLNVLF